MITFPDCVAVLLRTHVTVLDAGLSRIENAIVEERSNLAAVSAAKKVKASIDTLDFTDTEKESILEVFGSADDDYNEKVSHIGGMMRLAEKVASDRDELKAFVEAYLPQENAQPTSDETQLELFDDVKQSPPEESVAEQPPQAYHESGECNSVEH